jgi:uncharacterized lipoprotein YddW (UPF0748 family)
MNLLFSAIRKSKFQKAVGIFLVMLMSIVAIPMESFASTNWRDYSEYIPPSTPVAKRHLRGAWISTVVNLDWPSAQARDTVNDAQRISRSKQELIDMLDKAVDMNMNAVFFQVSPEGDAFYNSNIVPWSRYLTGTFGKNPGFDPLQFAIEEAHKRNLELHAWFNPYRVAMNTTSAMKSTLNIEKSVYRDHPDWIREASNRIIVDPGIPAARNWVASRVMEVVRNYDVDGIHFDDYFYLDGIQDQSTYNQYKGSFTNIGDWRRNNTYVLVKDISQRIAAEKSWVKFGISPSGVWANNNQRADGSATRAGLTNYYNSYADTKKWVQEEIIDYIAPQVYWSFALPAAPYGVVATWWSDVVRGRDVHLYIGQALYKVNDKSSPNYDPYFQGYEAVEEVKRQLKFNTVKPEIMGSILFRFKNLYDPEKQLVVNMIDNDMWANKALVPVMPWKGGASPNKPINSNLQRSGSGLRLSWTDNDSRTAYYAVYKVDKSIGLDVNSNQSARYLIGTVRKSSGSLQQFVDNTTTDLNNTVYAVTALDRLHNESRPTVTGYNNSKHFYDVGANSAWAIQAIDWLHERDVVQGVGNGLFAPSSNVKRADFLVMAMRTYGIAPAASSNNFADAGNTYYTNYLAKAKQLGIVTGVGDNRFLPENSITRQDMFVILYRILNELDRLPTVGTPVATLADFTDSSQIASYAVEPMKLFVETGVVRGDGQRLTPRANSTRAQAAQVLYNLITR